MGKIQAYSPRKWRWVMPPMAEIAPKTPLSEVTVGWFVKLLKEQSIESHCPSVDFSKQTATGLSSAVTSVPVAGVQFIIVPDPGGGGGVVQAGQMCLRLEGPGKVVIIFPRPTRLVLLYLVYERGPDLTIAYVVDGLTKLAPAKPQAKPVEQHVLVEDPGGQIRQLQIMTQRESLLSILRLYCCS
jgi:hypothetical protein